MADERKAHIIRIKGKQKNPDGGEPTTVDDIYADVRRIDEITVIDRGDGQKIIREFAWDDGFNPDQPDIERTTTELKLTDPENPPDDPDDPDVYIPLKVIDRLTVMDADQRIFYEFANKVDPDNPTTRSVKVRRVTFAETTPADIPDPISAEEYERDIATVDDSQFLDVEVINTYKYDDADQLVHNELDQDDNLLNQFEVSPEVDDNGEDIKPIRLDPLQNIVNVQWAGNPEFFWSGIDGIPSDAPGGLEGDGYVYQNSCPAADSYSFSMSAFVRVKFPAVSAGDDGLDYYHIFLMIPDVEGFFDQDHEPPEHDFYAKWQVGINIWLEDDRTSDSCILRLWWGSRPIDLNDSAINVPSPDIGEPERVGLQFPPFVHSAIVHYQENSFIEKEKVRDGFHLFITIDNSLAASYAPLGDPADVPATQLSGPKFEIWVDGDDYGSLAGPRPGNKAGQAIPLLGWTRATVAEPVYGGGETPNMFDIFEQGTDLGIIHIGGDTIETTTVEFGQVADVGANKFAYSGLQVGFPLVGDPTQGYSAETDPFEASIQLAKVQVWTDQIISPSNIVPYFLTEEGKKPVSVSAAQEKFGKAAYVLDGPPKSFAANKRGSAGEMTLAGRIRTGNIRRSDS